MVSIEKELMKIIAFQNNLHRYNNTPIVVYNLANTIISVIQGSAGRKVLKKSPLESITGEKNVGTHH